MAFQQQQQQQQQRSLWIRRWRLLSSQTRHRAGYLCVEQLFIMALTRRQAHERVPRREESSGATPTRHCALLLQEKWLAAQIPRP
jgi:hypothetical protein